MCSGRELIPTKAGDKGQAGVVHFSRRAEAALGASLGAKMFGNSIRLQSSTLPNEG